MSELTPRDRELVALGAAMGSNCVPCVEYHIPEARKVGLADAEIHAAIRHADKIRQVPARRTLQAALKLLPVAAECARNDATDDDCNCGTAKEGARVEPDQTAQPRDMMMGMMSRVMDICAGQGQSAAGPNSAEKRTAADPARSEGCGCG